MNGAGTYLTLSQTYFNSLASYIFNLSTFHNIASSFSSFGYDRNTSNVLNIVANPHSNPNMEPIDLPVVNMSNTHYLEDTKTIREESKLVLEASRRRYPQRKN